MTTASPNDFPTPYAFRLPDVFLHQIEGDGPFFVNHFGADRPSRMRIGFSRHAISIVLSGEKHLIVHGKSMRFEAGQVLIYRAGLEMITEDSSDYRSLILFLTPGDLGRLLRQQSFALPDPENHRPYNFFEANAAVRARVQSIYDHADQHGMPSAAIRNQICQMIVLSLLENAGTDSLACLKGSPVTEANTKIATILDTHWRDVSSISELASLANMSRATFIRHTKRIYGLSPSEWLNERRMGYAWHMLAIDGQRPSQVAQELGFSGHSAFSQAFRRHFGMSPSEANLSRAQHDLQH